MLNIEHISYSYGKKQVLKDLSLTLGDGECLAVMGASGCGKSTLLHLIAGLKHPDSGSIHSTFQKPAYVFQEPRLFPWLTVRENLLAVLARQSEKDEQEAESILSALGLADCASLYPAQLSGGMKSRVALARALLYDGDLFLLDEPFAALDEARRHQLIALLRNRFQERGASAILVTHQKEDAVAFANRLFAF